MILYAAWVAPTLAFLQPGKMLHSSAVVLETPAPTSTGAKFLALQKRDALGSVNAGGWPLWWKRWSHADALKTSPFAKVDSWLSSNLIVPAGQWVVLYFSSANYSGPWCRQLTLDGTKRICRLDSYIGLELVLLLVRAIPWCALLRLALILSHRLLPILAIGPMELVCATVHHISKVDWFFCVQRVVS